MRMWKVNPRLLCNKHLFGEHVEMHMFVGTIRSKKRMTGYFNNKLVEIDKILDRHYDLVREILRRGYNHQSPIKNEDVLMLKEYDGELGTVNVKHNIEDLKNRCPECRERLREVII